MSDLAELDEWIDGLSIEFAQSKADALRSAAVGKPAKIKWPHRVLHEGAETIETLLRIIQRQATSNNGWQPIESAPRDGTRIITITPGIPESLCVAYWRKAKHWRESDMFVRNVWSEEIGPTTTMVNNTLWQDLPAAPKGD